MVKKGYINTDIGLIPEEWKLNNLGNLCQVYRGGSPRPIWAYLTNSPNGINWIKIGDVKEGEKYITSTEEKIIQAGVPRSREVHSGDLILSNSMSFGRPYILKIDGCIHDGWLTIQEYQNFFDVDYLYYLLCSRPILEQYSSMAAGSSVKNLNKEKVKSLRVFFPDKTEQRAISEVLSEIDKLISKIEELANKKKRIKHGAMQRLLSGNFRLPGYSGAWSHMVIGKYGYLQKGSINPQLQPEAFFNEYSMLAFDEGRRPYKVQGRTMHSNRTLIKGRVLLFNKLNVRQRRVWYIDMCKENAVCSSEFLPYCSESIDLELLSQILQTDEVTEDFIGMSTGTSNSQKRITPRAFLEYSLFLPTDINEQKALAQIFRDMDYEIKLFEQKRIKFQLLKLGMMQKLLTGEIRLVEEV